MKRFFKGLITFILSVLMLASLFTYLTLRSAANVVNKENIKELVTTYDVVEVLESQGDTSGLESVYEDAKEYGISEETVDSVINSESFKELIGEVVGGAVDYAIYDIEINRDELPEMLVEVVEENIDRIDEEADLGLTEEEKEELIDVIEDNSEEFGEMLDITIETEVEEELKVVKLLLSTKLRVIFMALAIAFAVFIFLLNRKEYVYLKKYSSVLIFAAIQLILFGFAIELLTKEIIELENATVIMNPIIQNIKLNMIITSIVPLVLGIGLIFLRKYLLKKQPTILI